MPETDEFDVMVEAQCTHRAPQNEPQVRAISLGKSVGVVAATPLLLVMQVPIDPGDKTKPYAVVGVS